MHPFPDLPANAATPKMTWLVSVPPSDPPAVEATAEDHAALRQLLAVRPYVWLWVGRTSARLAVQIQSVALGWQVYTVARQSGEVKQAALALGAPAPSSWDSHALRPVTGL